MIDTKIFAECEACVAEATRAHCDSHFDTVREIAYEEGKKAGYDDGYEKAREEFEKTD